MNRLSWGKFLLWIGIKLEWMSSMKKIRRGNKDYALKIKIKTRLLAGFSIVLVFLLLISSISLTSLKNARDSFA